MASWVRSAGRYSALLVLVALVGCGDDDGSDKPRFMLQPDAGRVGPDDFVYADIEEPYPADDVEACKAYSAADEGLTAEEAATRECLCDTCLDLIRQCDALEGCSEIRRCATHSGCTNNTSCYFLPGSCREPIDRWGNGSVSAALAAEVATCNCRP